MASKNIKGITIEINGNSTKLQSALKDVDKQVYSLNSDLKNLNQALKLDPKNTELLAQKQDVLRRNIEETTNRLNTLKEAQRQMGSYSKLTDEQKKSYNALSLEITKGESALKGMKAELDGTSKVDMSGLKNGLSAVGSVAANVALKLAELAAAATAAMGALVAAGVKSYASLEQNLGAINKIYGDSADELVENAKQAYKTAGISANEYMETATAFSASLIKSLNGDTTKAASLTDRAIRDMSDNANTFGTSMDEVMNVYKALSKEQYTTLDNLRLGYSGTKKGMQELIKDAASYKDIQKEMNIEVKDGDMSFQNIINAISVMQNKLNITGTTAAEAEKTITGSVNSMRAAFSNFLNGTGSPEELSKTITNVLNNISKAIVELAPSILGGVATLISDLVPQIIQIIFDTLPTIFDAISQLVDSILEMTSDPDKLGETVSKIINTLVEFLTTNLPKVVQIGLNIILALAKGIAQSLPTMIPTIVDCILEIVNVLLDNLDLLIDATIQLVIGITEGLIEALPILLEKLPDIIVKIVEVLIENLPTLVEAVILIIGKLALAIIESIPKLLEAVVKIISSINDKIKELPGKLWEWAKNAFIKAAQGIAEAIPKIKEKVKSVFDSIVNGVKELPSKMLETGKNLVKGIWNGISNALDWIVDKIKGMGNSIMKAIKKVFGIASPSKLMRDEVGKNLALGIGEGFEENINSVEKGMINAIDVDGLVNDVNGAMKGLNAGIESSINPTINPNITYEANYKMMASAMKDALKDMVIELDDREVGTFVINTVSNEIYQ